MLALSSCNMIENIAKQVLPTDIEQMIPEDIRQSLLENIENIPFAYIEQMIYDSGILRLFGVRTSEAQFSKEEWIEMTSVTNFSIEYKHYNLSNPLIIQSTSNGKYDGYEWYRNISGYGATNEEIYNTVINGELYTVRWDRNVEGFVANKRAENDTSDTLRHLISPPFAERYYNHIKSSGDNKYEIDFISNDWWISYDFEVENGKITHMIETKMQINSEGDIIQEYFTTEYFDIGSTSIKIPDYVIAE